MRARFALLPADQLEAVADRVHESGLQRRRGIGGLQRFAHAFQSVGDLDEDVFAPARLQVVEHLQPKLRAFCLLDPNSEDVAGTVGQDGQPQPGIA